MVVQLGEVSRGILVESLVVGGAARSLLGDAIGCWCDELVTCFCVLKGNLTFIYHIMRLARPLKLMHQHLEYAHGTPTQKNYKNKEKGRINKNKTKR